MSTLPPELVALTSAASDGEKRRALEVAAALVALVDGGRADVAAGSVVAALVAAAVEVAASLARLGVPDRHFVAAIAACALFPLATRLGRRARLRRLRRRLAADAELASRRAEAAWARATPGQRAALQMLAKKSA